MHFFVQSLNKKQFKFVFYKSEILLIGILLI